MPQPLTKFRDVNQAKLMAQPLTKLCKSTFAVNLFTHSANNLHAQSKKNG